MSEQELLHTALVLPPRARRVLCVWAAVPGLVCAPFAFWQSVWAGAVFCAVWAALVALVRVRCCSFVAALTADSVTVQSGVAVPVQGALCSLCADRGCNWCCPASPPHRLPRWRRC